LKTWNPLADEAWHIPIIMEKREDLKENTILPQTSISGSLSDVVGGRDELLRMYEAPPRDKPESGQQQFLDMGMRLLERTGEFFGGTVRNRNGYGTFGV